MAFSNFNVLIKKKRVIYKKSLKKQLNKIGPTIDPCGASETALRKSL